MKTLVHKMLLKAQAKGVIPETVNLEGTEITIESGTFIIDGKSVSLENVPLNKLDEALKAHRTPRKASKPFITIRTPNTTIRFLED